MNYISSPPIWCITDQHGELVRAERSVGRTGLYFDKYICIRDYHQLCADDGQALLTIERCSLTSTKSYFGTHDVEDD